MYIRISFEQGQRLTPESLKLLEDTLADKVDCAQLYKKEDGQISTMWSYSETDDPKLVTEKLKLVYKVDLLQLTSDKEYIVDMELFFSKHPDLKVKMRGMPKTIIKDYQSIIQEIYAIQNKFEDALKSFNQQVEFNQKCDVHIANLGLLNINQVGYAVDYCTEALQEQINKGDRKSVV